MDKTKHLVGERVSQRMLTVAGPEGKLDEFRQRMAKIPGIEVWLLKKGSKDVAVTFLFTEQAEHLLDLLPMVGTKYLLGNQEVE